jgi:hypothetical protein
MAISYISTPQAIMPVYNSIYYVVSSNNVAQPNFKYVFNLFSGSSATGTAMSTIKLLPRPNDNTAIYNPARMLESLLSYDKNIQNITAPTISLNHYINYTVDFGEEYGPLSGITTYTGLTDWTSSAFNGVLQYNQIPSWQYTGYSINTDNPSLLQPATIGFLTNQPNPIYVKNATDRGTLSYLSLNSTVRYLNVFVTHADNTVTEYQLNVNTYTASTTNKIITHLPSGPWNLNNSVYSYVTGPTGYTQMIDTNNDLSYILVTSSGNTFHFNSLFKQYNIDQRCGKYTTVRLQFINRLGGFDYCNFDMISRKTINNIVRNEYKKNLAYNYSVGDRERTVINIDSNYLYSVNSNWMSDTESAWMEELVTSPEVYIINPDGSSRPVVVQQNSLEILKSINQKMIQYSFDLASSYQINASRA